jgi:hypothetical protein
MARVRVGDADGVADADAVVVPVAELLPVAEPLPVAELLAVAEPAEADAVPVAPDVDPPGVQAANAAAAVAAPKNSPHERRLISVERSNSRPRSWLGWGSWGRCGEVFIDP